MDPVNFAVAQNIKRLREKQKLSMDELSRLSGVSKSMLAQIERGDGNPTLSSLWKIANGMRVPFDALTARPKPDYQIIRLPDIQPILEDEGRVKNYSVFPDDEGRRFSVYYMELDPGSFWRHRYHRIHHPDPGGAGDRGRGTDLHHLSRGKHPLPRRRRPLLSEPEPRLHRPALDHVHSLIGLDFIAAL